MLKYLYMKYNHVASTLLIPLLLLFLPYGTATIAFGSFMETMNNLRMCS